MCSVPNMAIVCSSLMSCFPGMLLRYCQTGSEMIPFATVIIITFVVVAMCTVFLL